MKQRVKKDDKVYVRKGKEHVFPTVQPYPEHLEVEQVPTEMQAGKTSKLKSSKQ
jgi:hypothetical protein